VDSLHGCTLADFEIKRTLGEAFDRRPRSGRLLGGRCGGVLFAGCVLTAAGTGSFGLVRLVRHKKSGEHYALKMLSKKMILRTKQVDHIIAEKNILKAVMFPFIVNLYATFQDSEFLYLVLEYVIGGEFFSHLRKAVKFPNDTARFYAAAVVLAFEHLHKQNVIYRDLKPENLLLDRAGFLKICDFGFAKKVDPASKSPSDFEFFNALGRGRSAARPSISRRRLF
jgi:serine/threonine protein kinase